MIRHGSLPAGALYRRLEMKSDERGVFTEIYRGNWTDGPNVLQLNFIRSEGDVMRGVRVHFSHDDYLIVLQGKLSVGLRDLRRGSPTEGLTALVELRGEEVALLKTPAGVAHGLFVHEPSMFVLGVTQYHDPADENPCDWNDPGLEIPWPTTAATARRCEADVKGASLAALISRVPAWAG